MHVPLNDLKRIEPDLRRRIDDGIRRVVDRGHFVLGPELDSFEKEFAAYCGTSHCVGLGNGTDAIEIALRIIGCGPGDEVITVANAGMYSTTAILSVGAVPKYADIELETLSVNPESVRALLSSKTKAIIATHLYGLLAPIEELRELATAAGVFLIEDCAQSHGAERGGIKAGAFGDIGCFSFYPTKNLGALGDGGGITTSNDLFAEAAKRLRQYGWTRKYRSELSGGRNSRLDEIQAVVLREKLKHLDAWNTRRREICKLYREVVGSAVHGVDSADYVGHLSIVQVADRDKVAEKLAALGVSTAVHYPIPDYSQPSVIKQIGKALPLTVTEIATSNILTLPCFPEMTEQEVITVAKSLQYIAPRREVANSL